jgi:hypothetical protein
MRRKKEQLTQWPPAGKAATSLPDLTLVHAKMPAASFLQRLDHACFAGMQPEEMQALRQVADPCEQVHYKTGLAFDLQGKYQTHSVNHYHYIECPDTRQLHQKLVALLTIGEIVELGIIPRGITGGAAIYGGSASLDDVGATAAAAVAALTSPREEGSQQAPAEQKKLAVSNYPFFRVSNKNTVIVDLKFSLDLQAKETVSNGPEKDALLKDVCVDLYKKATVVGGECDTMQKCFDQTKLIWKSFFPPAKKAAKGASQAASADSDNS